VQPPTLAELVARPVRFVAFIEMDELAKVTTAVVWEMGNWFVVVMSCK
jgi:hypothetical protein